MKAIQITKFGGPEVMEYLDLADPIVKGSEELIKVTAESIMPILIKLRIVIYQNKSCR